MALFSSVFNQCQKLNVETPALVLVAGISAAACFSGDPIVSGLGAIAHSASVSHLVLKKSIPWPLARKGCVLAITAAGSVLNPRVAAAIGILVGVGEAVSACRRRCLNDPEETDLQRPLLLRSADALVSSVFGGGAKIEDRLVPAHFVLARIRTVDIVEISPSEAAALGVGFVACLSGTPFLATAGAAAYSVALTNAFLKKRIPSGLWRGMVATAVASGFYLAFSPFTVAVLGLGAGVTGLGSRLFSHFRRPQTH